MLALQQHANDGTIAASQPMRGPMDWLRPVLQPTTATEAAPAQPTQPTAPVAPTAPATTQKPWYKDWRVWAGIAGGTVVVVGGAYMILR